MDAKSAKTPPPSPGDSRWSELLLGHPGFGSRVRFPKSSPWSVGVVRIMVL